MSGKYLSLYDIMQDARAALKQVAKSAGSQRPGLFILLKKNDLMIWLSLYNFNDHDILVIGSSAQPSASLHLQPQQYQEQSFSRDR
jgi:hypothetical protein